MAFGDGDSGLTDLHCAKNAFGTSSSTLLVPFCTAQPTPPGGGREGGEERIHQVLFPPISLSSGPSPLPPFSLLIASSFSGFATDTRPPSLPSPSSSSLHALSNSEHLSSFSFRFSPSRALVYMATQTWTERAHTILRATAGRQEELSTLPLL